MRIKLLVAALAIFAIAAIPLFVGFDTSPPTSRTASMEKASDLMCNVNVVVSATTSAPAIVVDTGPASQQNAGLAITTQYAIERHARNGMMLKEREAPTWARWASTSSTTSLHGVDINRHVVRFIRT